MSRFNPYENISPWDYPKLRQILAKQYQNLPAPQIEALFENYDLSAENMEGILQDMGKVAGYVAPVVGAFVGGPTGAVVGAEVGKLAGKAVSQSTDRSRQPKVPPSTQAKAPADT